MCAARIVVARLGAPRHSGVLAPRGADQPVDRVVQIVPVRSDDLITEIHRLLCRIGNGRDVADRVVGIFQVLQDSAIAGARCLEMG